jgi:hypothetical protein
VAFCVVWIDQLAAVAGGTATESNAKIATTKTFLKEQQPLRTTNRIPSPILVYGLRLDANYTKSIPAE